MDYLHRTNGILIGKTKVQYMRMIANGNLTSAVLKQRDGHRLKSDKKVSALLCKSVFHYSVHVTMVSIHSGISDYIISIDDHSHYHYHDYVLIQAMNM